MTYPTVSVEKMHGTTVTLEAAMRGWCWALVREPDDRWTLRRRDWRTEELSEPVQTSDGPLEPYFDVVEWARRYVEQQNWTGDDSALVDPSYPYLRQAMKTAAKV